MAAVTSFSSSSGTGSCCCTGARGAGSANLFAIGMSSSSRVSERCCHRGVVTSSGSGSGILNCAGARGLRGSSAGVRGVRGSSRGTFAIGRRVTVGLSVNLDFLTGGCSCACSAARVAATLRSCDSSDFICRSDLRGGAALGAVGAGSGGATRSTLDRNWEIVFLPYPPTRCPVGSGAASALGAGSAGSPDGERLFWGGRSAMPIFLPVPSGVASGNLLRLTGFAALRTVGAGAGVCELIPVLLPYFAIVRFFSASIASVVSCSFSARPVCPANALGRVSRMRSNSL